MSQATAHAVYIWASYGAVAVVVAALVIWVMADGRRLARQLERLEAAGVRRRSQGSGPSGNAKI